MALTPAPRLDAVVAHVLAWHNRHPLARRIKVTEVGSIGLVSLPFAAPAQGATMPLAAFSEDFLPPLKPAAVGRWAARHAHAGVTVPPGIPLRQVVADGEGAALTLMAATAAIDVGSQHRRLLVGRGDPAAVLGRRIWSAPRVGAAAALVSALAALPLWPQLEPARVLAAALPQAEPAAAQVQSVAPAAWPTATPAVAAASAAHGVHSGAPEGAPEGVSPGAPTGAHAGSPEGDTAPTASAQLASEVPSPTASPARPDPPDPPATHATPPLAPSAAATTRATPPHAPPTAPDRALGARPAPRLGTAAARPLIRPQLDGEAKAEAREAVAEARRALGLPASPARTAIAKPAPAASVATHPAPATGPDTLHEGRLAQRAAPPPAAESMPARPQPQPQPRAAPAEAGTGPAFALSTRLLRTRAEAEQVMVAVQALLTAVRNKDNAPLQVEIVAVGEDWRVAAFPFRRQPEADQARALLASRGMRVSVVDF